MSSSTNSCRPHLLSTERCLNAYSAYIGLHILSRNQSAPKLGECGTKGTFWFSSYSGCVFHLFFHWNSIITSVIRGLACLRILWIWEHAQFQLEVICGATELSTWRLFMMTFCGVYYLTVLVYTKTNIYLSVGGKRWTFAASFPNWG